MDKKIPGLKSGSDMKINLDPIDYVVKGLLQAGTVNIAVGDSGLGKSALFYQMGIAVALGMPFLGMDTTQGSVIMFDYENGERRGEEIAQAVSRFYGHDTVPGNFFRWSEQEASELLETMISGAQPKLILIDALRGFRPNAEIDNPRAADMFRELYPLARKYNAAIVLAHHTRKNRDPKFPPPRLDDLNVSPLTWCEEAAGPRALVNQTHSRIGLARGENDTAMILRGHLKTEGEFGPIYIERVRDEYGDPIGYKRRPPVEAGLSVKQQAILDSLPEDFTYKITKLETKKSDASVTRLLSHFIALGVVEKDEKLRLYRKVH